MEYPSVAAIMTTYFTKGEQGQERWYAMSQTLSSWEKYLRYNGDLHIVISDDGSASPYDQMMPRWFDGYLIGTTRQERHGVGASLNAGIRRWFDQSGSPLFLYLVDDWSLTEPFDITPWCQLLLEREDIGMVRLGPPHPGTRGTVEAFTSNWQGWGLRLQKDKGFAFGHRPALYHKRMIDSYGWFKEDCSALECEDDYRGRVATITGPDIVLALPHPWYHIDTRSMSSDDPKGGK